jgi:hypothetical protein
MPAHQEFSSCRRMNKNMNARFMDRAAALTNDRLDGDAFATACRMPKPAAKTASKPAPLTLFKPLTLTENNGALDTVAVTGISTANN